MPALELYTSNRLEILAEALAEVVAQPMPPMKPETILVQSGGMQRWISMQLAQRHGICANAVFPFPVAFAYDICRKILPDIPKEYRLSKEKMLWSILRVLDAEQDNSELLALSAFARTNSMLQKVQLAERIAFHFDQYLLFRPHWAEIWESGRITGAFRTERNQQNELWQARLWRNIAAGHEQEHRAALLHRTIRILGGQIDTSALPTRVSIFGIPTLPPIYLDLLKALSNHVEVRIFLLNPCRQYWGDLLSRRDQQRAYRQHQFGLIEIEREEDTTPLAGLGSVGRDFHELLLERNVTETRTFFANVDASTLLGCIQADLLDLRVDADFQQNKPGFNDTSIQVHCCHSPLREMEVLKDLILDILQNNPDILPHDILVMNPDMDTYAPFIQAVFGTPEDQAQRIPFSIADRRPSKAAAAIRLFLELLDFGQYRFETSKVCALLEHPLIRASLGLDEKELTRILDWIRQSGIRWGVDAAFRQQYGLPYAQNTWASGLSRLYLGYMTGDHDPIQGIAPIAIRGASEHELLGRLTAWIDELQTLWARLQEPKQAAAWQELFLWMLETFFPKDRVMDEPALAIRKAMGDLTATMEDLSADSSTIRHLVRKRLDETSAESGFLASGLTFCGLKPMRSIPFRIVCLTGLTSTAFPRQDQTPGFDLMVARPECGDRSLREDDRYLFLESLISARSQFILTYPGLSQNDNSEAPPSVLVSELLDYLDRRCTVHGRKPSETLVIRHKLQAFHPDYVTADSHIFSYSRQNRDAARALFAPTAKPPLFGHTTEHAKTAEEITLDDLIRFFSNPSRHLLATLRIRPPHDEEEFLDEEPLAIPTGLDAYAPMQNLLHKALAEPDAQLEPLLESWQILPPEQAGAEAAQILCATVRTLAEQIRHATAGLPPQPADIALTVGKIRLTGRIRLYGEKQITFRLAKTKAKDMLGLWIRHLALLAAGYNICSEHLGKEDGFSAPFPPEPRSILKTLVHIYAQGQTRPLPLFPEASLAYAQKIQTGKNAYEALEEAWKIWIGSDYTPGDKDNPDTRLIYGDTEPDWEEFGNLATRVFLPLLGGGV